VGLLQAVDARRQPAEQRPQVVAHVGEKPFLRRRDRVGIGALADQEFVRRAPFGFEIRRQVAGPGLPALEPEALVGPVALFQQGLPAHAALIVRN